MKGIVHYVRVALMVLVALVCTLASAQDTYDETGGMVIMEMENTPSSLDEWVEINPGDANYVSGATGSGHLEFTGNSPTNGNPKSPLTYTFRINQGGNYYLNLRARKRLAGEPSDRCNDCYVKMEGNFTSGSSAYPTSTLTQNTKLYGGDANGWGWATNLDGNGADHKAAIYTFVASETYTLTISGRSQRFNIDRIVLRHSSVDNSTARDPNQPESPYISAGPTKYSLTVNNGSGSGLYLEGEVVTVIADAAPVGQVFYEWTGDTASLADVNDSTSTVTMLPSATEITATYLYDQKEILVEGMSEEIPNGDASPQVSDGTDFTYISAGGEDTHTFVIRNMGNTALSLTGTEVVEVDGDAGFSLASPPSTVVPAGGFVSFDIRFSTTTLGPQTATISIENDDADENPYTFAVKAECVSTVHQLAVFSGTGGGSYPEGHVVTITADAPPAGSVFTYWTGHTAGIANLKSPTTTLIMPAADIAVVANFGQPPYVPPQVDYTAGGSDDGCQLAAPGSGTGMLLTLVLLIISLSVSRQIHAKR